MAIEGTNMTSTEPPNEWRPVHESEYGYLTQAAWVHTKTGLRVRVESQHRPSQMHTPEQSTDDTGYITMVRGDVTEQITTDLASRENAYRRAHELMRAFPDGDFEPVLLDIQWEGPRDREEWFQQE